MKYGGSVMLWDGAGRKLVKCCKKTVFKGGGSVRLVRFNLRHSKCAARKHYKMTKLTSLAAKSSSKH